MPTPIVIRVYRGDTLLRTEQFSREIVKIGRMASAHLVLDEDGIARIHAVIEVAPGGALSIIDMGSAGGTVVNGKKVSRSTLEFGDVITVGPMRLVVDAAEGAAEVTGSGAPPPEAAAPAPAPAAVPASSARPTVVVSAVKAPEPVAAKAPAAPAPAPAAQAPAPAPGAAAAFRAPAAAVKGRQLKVADAVTEDLSSETDLGVELRILWGDTLIEAGTFRAPSTPVLVGETPKCAFRLAGVELPVAEFPLLRHEAGDYRVAFARGMTGILDDKGKRTSLAKLVRERKATADEKIDGAYTVGVPRVGAVRLELGSRLAIEARARRPMEVKGSPFWERINYQFLNLFLVLFFLQGAFVVATENFPYDTDIVADDLFKNPARMAKFIIKPPEQQKIDLGKGEKKAEESGEAAEKHKGEEGKMGKKDAAKTNARSAPKAIDPNAKEIVKRSGLLGALGRGGGGLSTVFGSGGLGGDLRGAVGNMFGPVVGDSYGLGGLGIRGSGSGGGGGGETIGIGAVGTKGRGGGLGSYGTGVGGLGKKSDRDVNISTGTAVVMGSIDKELVRKVIQDHAAQIRYCYEQQLAVNPRLQGKVSIKWIINAEGAASSAQIDGSATSLEDAKVHECMMARITSWAFPKPKGGGIAVITYPWILRSSGGGAA